MPNSGKKNGEAQNALHAEESSAITRRELLRTGSGALLMVGLGGAVSIVHRHSEVVRPPGASGEPDLLARCIHCGQCVEVCPHGVITTERLSQSILGRGTPALSFRAGYCDLCKDLGDVHMRCIDTCPTGALQPVLKRRLVLGVARILTSKCIAWQWRGCDVCYKLCPTKAIMLEGDHRRPRVIADKCNGCGLCEMSCPSPSFRSYGEGGKAIVVEAMKH